MQVSGWDGFGRRIEPGDVVVEAFGCDLTLRFQAAIAAKAQARGRQPAWINLEYLTAESYVERSHGLPSPVLSGPAAGLTKHFFYPGFTPRTGGLLREPDLERARRPSTAPPGCAQQGIARRRRTAGQPVLLRAAGPRQLLAQLGSAGQSHPRAGHRGPRRGGGRAALAKRTGRPGLEQRVALSITWLPLLSQPDFDHLLWACDLNFVRGEDSLVRALWAGKPLVWQIYPQDDEAHHAKLAAFLDWLGAPAGLAGFPPCLERHRRATAAGRSPGVGCLRTAQPRAAAGAGRPGHAAHGLRGARPAAMLVRGY